MLIQGMLGSVVFAPESPLAGAWSSLGTFNVNPAMATKADILTLQHQIEIQAQQMAELSKRLQELLDAKNAAESTDCTRGAVSEPECPR